MTQDLLHNSVTAFMVRARLANHQLARMNGKSDQEGCDAIITIVRGEIIRPIAALTPEWMGQESLKGLFRPTRHDSDGEPARLIDCSIAIIAKQHAA